MKSLIVLMLVLTVGIAGQDKIKKSQNPVPNSYIVVSEDMDEELQKNKNIKIKHKFKKVLNGYVLKADEEEIKKLSKNSKVLYIEEDSKIKIQSQNNVIWNLDRLDQTAYPLDNKFISVYNGSGVDIYIMDTGININHQDFEGRASVAVDYINDGNLDCNGHGTHVAGSAGGATYGVAKKSYLKAIRVADCSGYGQLSTWIQGMDWVVVNKVRPSVINLSYALSGTSTSLQTAINNTVINGVSFAVAAGNSGMDACYMSPSNSKNAVVVGSMVYSGSAETGFVDYRMGYSNWGACVDLHAPGNGIVSSSNADNVSTRIMNGTSMASPHVAGAIALFMQYSPETPALQISSALKQSAVPDVITNVPVGTPNFLLNINFKPKCIDGVTYYGEGSDIVYHNITGTATNFKGSIADGVLTLERKQGKVWSSVAVSTSSISYAGKRAEYRWSTSGLKLYRACLAR